MLPSISLIILGFNWKLVSCQISIIGPYDIIPEKIESIKSLPEVYFVRKDVTNDPNYRLPIVNILVWIDGYEKFTPDGVYKKSAISISATACEALAGKFLFNKDFAEHGNFTTCPVKPAIYALNDYCFDSRKLPPEVPGTYWRLDLRTGLERDKTNPNRIAYCQIFVRIERTKRRPLLNTRRT